MKWVKKGGVCHLNVKMSLYVFSEPSGGGIFAKPHGPPCFDFPIKNRCFRFLMNFDQFLTFSSFAFFTFWWFWFLCFCHFLHFLHFLDFVTFLILLIFDTFLSLFYVGDEFWSIFVSVLGASIMTHFSSSKPALPTIPILVVKFHLIFVL